MAQNECNINDIYMIDLNFDQPDLLLPAHFLKNEKDKKEFLEEEVNRMLEANVIQPSSSPWSSSVVLVNQKDK
ncbi:8262_t:CDS:2, partial [Gigaspora margarita]